MSDLTLSKPAFVNLCKCGCGVLVKQLWCSRQAAEKHRGIARKKTERCQRTTGFYDGTQKLCLDCNTVKPVEMFTKTLYNQTGRKTYCKACLYARKKQDRQQKSAKLQPEREAKFQTKQAELQQKQLLKQQEQDLKREEKKRIAAIRNVITELKKRNNFLMRLEALSAIETAAAITDAKRLAQHKTMILNRKPNGATQTTNELCALRIRAQCNVQVAKYIRGYVFSTTEFAECVGYTIPELVAHITKQFRVGMDWHIGGSFHIDHIIPISYLFKNYPPEQAFYMAYKLTNLRPLYPHENRKKSATLIPSLLSCVA